MKQTVEDKFIAWKGGVSNMADSEKLDLLLQKTIGIETEMQNLRNDIDEFKQDTKEVKTDIIYLKSEVSSLRSNVDILKVEVAVLREDVEILKVSVNILKQTAADKFRCCNFLFYMLFFLTIVQCNYRR